MLRSSGMDNNTRPRFVDRKECKKTERTANEDDSNRTQEE